MGNDQNVEEGNGKIKLGFLCMVEYYIIIKINVFKEHSMTWKITHENYIPHNPAGSSVGGNI